MVGENVFHKKVYHQHQVKPIKKIKSLRRKIMATLFEQKKAAIREEAMKHVNKNGEPTRGFSKSQFNELAAAYLNSPDYVDTQLKTKDGAATLVETTPVKDFRENIIGGIAKAAGLDKAEQEQLVNSYQFSPKADYHSFVNNTIEAYAGDACRKFTFNQRPDMAGSIVIETIPEVTKEVSVVGSDVKKNVKYGQYKKVKAKSTCPKHLREDV